MNLSTSRQNVRALAKQYGVSEIHIREMIAIETGEMKSDIVVDYPPKVNVRLAVGLSSGFALIVGLALLLG